MHVHTHNFRIKLAMSRLVIGTSRTVGSAKKFVRITSGFGGADFTKTLRKVCTRQKLKFSFLSGNLSILQKTITKTSKSPHAFAMCSIRTDLLKQENEKIDSL